MKPTISSGITGFLICCAALLSTGAVQAAQTNISNLVGHWKDPGGRWVEIQRNGSNANAIMRSPEGQGLWTRAKITITNSGIKVEKKLGQRTVNTQTAQLKRGFGGPKIQFGFGTAWKKLSPRELTAFQQDPADPGPGPDNGPTQDFNVVDIITTPIAIVTDPIIAVVDDLPTFFTKTWSYADTGSFFHKKDDKWTECWVDGRISNNFTHSNQTNKYIEIYDQDRQTYVRLYSTHADVLESSMNQWAQFANGGFIGAPPAQPQYPTSPVVQQSNNNNSNVFTPPPPDTGFGPMKDGYPKQGRKHFRETIKFEPIPQQDTYQLSLGYDVIVANPSFEWMVGPRRNRTLPVPATITTRGIWKKTGAPAVNPIQAGESRGFAVTYSVEITEEESDEVNVGLSASVTAGAKPFGVGAEVTVQASLGYAHTWSRAVAESKSITHTLPVPAGSTMQAWHREVWVTVEIDCRNAFSSDAEFQAAMKRTYGSDLPAYYNFDGFKRQGRFGKLTFEYKLPGGDMNAEVFPTYY